MDNFKPGPDDKAMPPSTGIEREFAERDALERQSESWRGEIANRVEGYRVRRSKRTLAGEFSMKLDFEPRQPMPRGSAMPVAYYEPEPEPQPAPTRRESPRPPVPRTAAPSPAPREPFEMEEEDAPQQKNPALWPGWVQPRLAATSSTTEPKVIEFPRSLLFPEMDQRPAEDQFELAEPILRRPRILDVPETVTVTAPPLAGLALEQPSDEDETDAERPSLELPIQTAGLLSRIFAALVDGILIAAYLAVFGLVVLRGVHGLVLSKSILAVGVAIPVLFWSAYHYVFLVYGAQTPGMKLAGLKVGSLDGRTIGPGQRRWRALWMVLSFVSLGLGFWWALFDDQSLCWHDRLTQTCLTSAR